MSSIQSHREQSSRLKLVAIPALFVVCLTSACAGTSRSPDNEPPAVSNPGVAWEDGRKSVETGEALLIRGERRLALGRQQIRDGEARIRDGSERAAQAKLDYQQLAGTTDELPAAEKKSRAEILRTVGSRWQAAIEEIKDGNRLIKTGNANVTRGEAEIREGRMLMESGSILMRNSYRSRLGQKLLPLPSKK